jgi:hypothetical protein
MYKKLIFLSLLLCAAQVQSMDKIGIFSLVHPDNLPIIVNELSLPSLNSLQQTSKAWHVTLKHNFDLKDTSSKAYDAVKNDDNLRTKAMIWCAKDIYHFNNENTKNKKKIFRQLGKMNKLDINKRLRPMLRSRLMQLRGEQGKKLKKEFELINIYAGHPGGKDNEHEQYTWYYGDGVDPLLLEVMLEENDTSTVKSEDWDFDMFYSNVKQDRIRLQKLFYIFMENGKKERINFCDYQGKTALHVVCDRGWDESILLLMMNGANLNCKDNDGNTPLINACLIHDCAIIEQLLGYEADVNATNNNKETPLTIACQGRMSTGKYFNKIESIKCLLFHGADINCFFPNEFEGAKTPLEYMRKHQDQYQDILQKYDANEIHLLKKW